MPDAVGYRAKFGVIIPSTNTVVEAEYNAMRPPGITFHAGRMYIQDPQAGSDDAFEALIAQIRTSLDTAVRDVMTAKPDHLIMGMSVETFWDGVEGNRRFIERVKAMSGLDVTTGASACKAALDLYGAKTIAVITPYQPIGDKQVIRFFEDVGFKVERIKGLRCPSATAIAEVTEDVLRRAIQEIDGADIDAIVQVGTNLAMVRLADEAERWLDKPVIAINAATLWHALRTNGFNDQLHGFGSLLREH